MAVDRAAKSECAPLSTHRTKSKSEKWTLEKLMSMYMLVCLTTI